jgi:electron transfer flavoprotein alpha/beta subunit
MADSFYATVRYQRVKVETIEQHKRVQRADLVTIAQASKLLERDISTVSRWVGCSLPEIILTADPGINRPRRYTSRQACVEAKKGFLGAKKVAKNSRGLRALSDYAHSHPSQTMTHQQ